MNSRTRILGRDEIVAGADPGQSECDRPLDPQVVTMPVVSPGLFAFDNDTIIREFNRLETAIAAIHLHHGTGGFKRRRDATGDTCQQMPVDCGASKKCPISAESPSSIAGF